MGGHRQSTNIRSSIKARGPPGPIHSIQQQPPSVPSTNVVDNGHDRMVMKITSGGGSRSGSPTPRNSPKSTHQILEEYQLQPHQVTFFRTKAFYVLTLQKVKYYLYLFIAYYSILQRLLELLAINSFPTVDSKQHSPKPPYHLTLPLPILLLLDIKSTK